MIALLVFPFYYLWAVVSGSLRIARDVLSPHPRIAPVLVKVPLSLPSSRQRLLLAYLITMTPGTLSVDERDGCLLIHSLYDAENPQDLVDEILKRYQPVVARLPF
ncbi:MAG: Na+/H+ antiporter subunit E [Verrucomicrobiota bacterium]